MPGFGLYIPRIAFWYIASGHSFSKSSPVTLVRPSMAANTAATRAQTSTMRPSSLSRLFQSLIVASNETSPIGVTGVGLFDRKNGWPPGNERHDQLNPSGASPKRNLSYSPPKVDASNTLSKSSCTMPPMMENGNGIVM